MSTHPSINVQVRERVRWGLDLTALIGGSLGTLATLAGFARGTANEPLVAISIMVALALCGALGLTRGARWTPYAYIVLVVTANIVYLLLFGPWIGLGAVYVLALAIAMLFMSDAWSWIVGVVLVGTHIFVGLLHRAGMLDHASGLQLDAPGNWRRATIAALSALAGIGMVVSYTVEQLVTERREIEKALRTEREERLQLARIDAEIGRVRRADSIAQLAAEVGADIGAALEIIHTRATALRAELHSTEAAECLVDLVDVTTVARGTMRTLTVFAPDATPSARGDATEAVRMLPKLVRRIIPARIGLEITAEDDLFVGIETSDLSRVIANLALNARDAIRDNGTITVRATVDGAHVRIVVSDDGAGMGPDILGQLFQPFFTTKPVGRGTGLGLATTKILVERASGTIDVKSDVGRGTTFTLLLPRLVTPRTS